MIIADTITITVRIAVITDAVVVDIVPLQRVTRETIDGIA